jgi:hypothetical protein
MEKDVKEDTRTVKVSFLLNLLSERISRSHCRERADHDAAEVSWIFSGLAQIQQAAVSHLRTLLHN